MSDATELRTSAEATSSRLRREVGILAGRLAALLGHILPESRAQSVLQTIFDEIADGRPLSEWEPSAVERRPAGVTDPLDRLVTAMGLSGLEVDLILLAGFPEEHEALAAVLRGLHPRGEPRATVGLIAQLFCRSPGERSILRELLESGPAARAGVFRLGADGPFPERNIELPEALWSVLHGLDVWPAALTPRHAAVTLAGLEDWLSEPAGARACAALACAEPWTILVTADDEETALHRAAALARHAGVESVQLRVPPGAGHDLERLMAAHATARGVVPILCVGGSDGPARADAPAFTGYPGSIVLCGRTDALTPSGPRPVTSLIVKSLSATARKRMWSQVLPELAGNAAALSASYSLEPAAVARIATDTRSVAALEGHPVDLTMVAESIRIRSAIALSAGLKLIRPTARWDQLVLPPDRAAQLREAMDRLLYQGRVLDEWRFLEGRPGARGVRMLFAGPPGTGKTFAAEVIAGALGVDLMMVDISRVVSKWIGETEKNLADVFAVAERAQSVLLFDEADSFFGRRTDLNDAHDRNANQQTAYLLSRIERFEGLAILSTNLRQNMDPAFTRRLEFVVEFDEPGLSERRALWSCHLPKAAPLHPDVNVAELAAIYPVVGGVVRNAAVAAGFLAAAEGAPIARRHIICAIRREYEKAGRAFPGLPAGMSAP